VTAAVIGPANGGGDVVTSPQAGPSAAGPSVEDTTGGGSPSPEELLRLVDGPSPDPAATAELRFVSDAPGDDGAQTAVQLEGVGGGDLPLTGFALVALVFLLGLWLASAGTALRKLPTQV
jgi:hypothetical protein